MGERTVGGLAREGYGLRDEERSCGRLVRMSATMTKLDVQKLVSALVIVFVLVAPAIALA
jgi:hypothetical protein